MKDRRKKWQEKQKAQGNCGQCGKPKDGPFKRLCIECGLKNREVMRRRTKSKPHSKKGRPPYEIRIQNQKH